MFIFYVKILSILLCLFLGSANASTSTNTIPADKQANAKIESLIQSMHEQGFSEEEIVEQLQKIGIRSGKKNRRMLYLALGTTVFGIAAAATIGFLIQEIIKRHDKIQDLEGDLRCAQAKIKEKSGELDSQKHTHEEAISKSKQELQATADRMQMAEAKLGWMNLSHPSFKTVYVTNQSARQNAITLGFIPVMLTQDQMAKLGIES
jgi:hypothetical protein